MEVNESISENTERQKENLENYCNNLLTVIYPHLLIWILSTCSVVFFNFLYNIFIEKELFSKYLLGQNLSFPFFTFKHYFSWIVVLSIACFNFLLFVLLFFVNGKVMSNGLAQKNQLNLWMFISSWIINSCIFITGGFLDSPLTPVLAIFIGSFLILQEDNEMKKTNISLVIFNMFLLCYPYIYVYWKTQEDLQFIIWSNDREYTLIRFVVSFTVTVITIYQVDNIHKKIREFKNSMYVAGAK